MVDIIFAVNNPLKGAQTLLYESTDVKDQSLILKVAVKAQLTLSLTDKDPNVHSADAVLPFPDLQKTSFSYLFSMNSDSGQITGSISYIVPQSENISLFKNVPELKEKLNYIANQLQSWIYKTDATLPKIYYDMIMNILFYETDTSYKVVDVASILTTEKSPGAPDYLIKNINKNLEHLFFELYVNKPVIVLGRSKIAVEYAMPTLDFLAPNKKLRKVIFSEYYIDPAPNLNIVDVIGVSSVHEKKYKDYLVVDVDKFEIKNTKGKKPYFKNFFDAMNKSPTPFDVQDIIKFINHLDELKKPIEDILGKKDVSEETFKKFLKTLTKDEANAVMDIESALHPTASKSFAQQFSGKLSNWIDDLR